MERDFILAQFSHKKKVAIKEYERFVKGHSGQGYREDFYGVKDQRFLGEDSFVEHVHRRVNENPPFVYTISLGEIVSEVSSVLNISPDLFYTPTRNRQGALGRSLVGYLGRKLGSHQIKETADHFHRDPVVISQGIKRLENTLKEKKEFVTAVSDIEQSLIRKSSRRILI